MTGGHATGGLSAADGYTVITCSCEGGPYLGARKAGTPCCCERCGFITADQLAAILATRAAQPDANTALDGIHAEVKAERERAHAKHGDTSMESSPWEDPTGRRYRILVEEVGEVAEEFNDAEHDQRPVDGYLLRKELVQVAAMAAAWADVIPRAALTPPEDQPPDC